MLTPSRPDTSLEALQRGAARQALPPAAAEHQVLDDGEARHQQHMLEHRADAEFETGRGEVILTGRAADQDLAFVRLLHAGQHADQGRLAGAVLAQQNMDLARH